MSAAAAPHSPRVDVDSLKRACVGRWREILTTLGGVPVDHLDSRRQHPCPRCGGDTRFRVFPDFDQTGGVICHHCHSGDTEPKNGDGIAAIRWLLGCDFGEAVAMLAEHVGLSPTNGKPAKLDPLEALARDKRVSVDGFLAFGARIDGRNVAFPCYGPDGEQCTTFRVWAGDKGKFEAGKPAGLFFPQTDQGNVRLPLAGETWHLVEGVKDAAALWDLGYLTVGLNTCELAQKYARLFRGCDVVFIPDRDKAGENGAKKSASRLRGHAASVRVATLPAEYRESSGDDVRDVLAKRDGEAMLRDAIEAAVRVDSESATLTYHRITAAELDEQQWDIDYIIPDVVAARHVGGIIGASKTLKTSIAADLAFSVATGGHFLGYWPVARTCRVGFMSGESGTPTIQETLRRIARAAGKTLRDADGLIISDQLPQFGQLDHMDALRRFIDEDEIELLIVDPLYLAADTQGKESSLFAMGALLRAVAKVVDDCGATLLIAHHSTQAAGRDNGKNPELFDSAWAGTQQFFRQWIALNRRKPYDPEQGGHHELRLVTGGSMGHSAAVALDIDEGLRSDDGGRRWEVSVRPLAESANEDAQRREAERQALTLARHCHDLRQALKQFPAGNTATALRQATGLNARNFGVAITTLMGEGRAEACEVTKSNGRFDGYKPTEHT